MHVHYWKSQLIIVKKRKLEIDIFKVDLLYKRVIKSIKWSGYFDVLTCTPKKKK